MSDFRPSTIHSPSAPLPPSPPESGRTRTLTSTLPLLSFDVRLLSVGDFKLPNVPLSPRVSSPTSSNVVPSVILEPFADELRLSGGEGMLRRLSDPLAPDISLLSPVPFSRLGVPVQPGVGASAALARRPYAELRAFGFLLPPSALRSFVESRF